MNKDNIHNNSDTDILLPPIGDSRSHIESREILIRSLASNLQNVKTKGSRKKASRSRKARNKGAVSYESVMRNVDSIQEWIETAYQFLKGTNDPDLKLSYASEWLMDNFYLITQTIRLIREDISSGFYTDLPKIDGGPQDGYARIFVFAANALAHQELLFDSVAFEQILLDLQQDIQFETAEIWALPIFLRLFLFEYLADTLS